MKLIIAEKPELAEDIAKAILKEYKTLSKGHYINNEFVCISAFGHLLSLKEPEEINEIYTNRSNIDLLPIYFKNWERTPDKEPYKYNRLKQIGQYIKQCDSIIHAGDPDEEGQLLIDEIIEYYKYTGRVYRVLVNDNIEKNIVKAFQDLSINDSSFKNKGKSAYARQMADKAVGINESRLACNRLNVFGLSIGRVQTPTLALIVNRDLSIEQHQEQKFYTLSININLQDNESSYKDIPFSYYPSEEVLGDDKYIYSKDVFNQVITKVNVVDKVKVINYKKENKPPFPFSLTTLSSLMNKKYGYTSAKTLSITQELRDKFKAITYNRTDSEYLKEEHYLNAPKLIPIIFGNIDKVYPVDFNKKSECFNDNLAPTHHAIIPQEKRVDMSVFSEEQKNIYIEICNRYIMQFLPNETRDVCESVIPIGPLGELKYNCSKNNDPGYKKYFTEINDNDLLKHNTRFLIEGEYRSLYKNFNIDEKFTKPLKAYTEGTLIKDMCNISKYVTDPQLKNVLRIKDKGKKGENGSIGTTATRASIIELLKKRGFVELQGRNLVSTKLARDFIEILPESLKTANMTAQWCLLQDMVREGAADENIVMLSAIKDFKDRFNSSYVNASLKRDKTVFCKCPYCGGDIIKRTTKNGLIYICEDYGENCPTLLKAKTKYFDSYLNITDIKAKALLENKSVKFKIKNKKGTSYNALMHIEYSNNKYLNIKKTKD